MPTNQPTARARMDASNGRRCRPRDPDTFRAARAEAGLTQAAVAHRAGCTEGFYWRFERSEWVSLALAEAIAKALGRDVSDLFEEEAGAA